MVTVDNIGNAPLTAVAPGLTALADFIAVEGSGIPPDCTSAFSIAPCASCSLSIDFAPTTVLVERIICFDGQFAQRFSSNSDHSAQWRR